jgi:hypothetical protein
VTSIRSGKPEASLAWAAATPLVKRRQQEQRPPSTGSSKMRNGHWSQGRACNEPGALGGLDARRAAAVRLGLAARAKAPGNDPVLGSDAAMWKARLRFRVGFGAALGCAVWLALSACGETSPGAESARGACHGATECSGACVDLQNGPNHCGECRNACAPGQPCGHGTCVRIDVAAISTRTV